MKTKLKTLKTSFTMMELLIVIAIIAVLGAVAIALINPWTQLAKGRDARRKSDLDKLRNALEDFYNDKGCYPLPNEICYTSPPDPNCQSGRCKGVSCYICGNEPTSPSFPYLSKLPCDPEHPKYRYVYQVEGNDFTGCPATCAVKSCPSWYRIYSALSIPWSKENDILGCGEGGCGIYPSYGFDYGVTSPNTKVQVTNSFGCWLNTPAPAGTCELRSPYEEALKDCEIVYPSDKACCSRVPKPSSCF